IAVRENGLVGPEIPPDVSGASTFANPEGAPPTGHVWKVERELILVTAVLGVWADGIDATPPGPHPPSHHTVYPTVALPPEIFVQTFLGLPWRYVYFKKHPGQVLQ
ncbi:MAG: hypothetical protein L0312_24555, partial [Acidobacteria bacterium]|nr:hypothetical protein [Acidobacteriota bacterium]